MIGSCCSVASGLFTRLKVVSLCVSVKAAGIAVLLEIARERSTKHVWVEHNQQSFLVACLAV